MALTLPLLLLVGVGIFEFGRAYQTWQVLTNAAREGARIAVLPYPVPGAVEARVRDYMTAGHLSAAASATITVDSTRTIPIGGANVASSLVTVTYPFTFMVLQPIAQLVASGTMTGSPITMSASATMRNEF